MKRFMLASTFLIIFLVIFDLFYYELGFFIDFDKEKNVDYFIKTKEKDFYINKDGKYEKFEIKGVDLGTGIPGHFATDYAIDKKTYKRWFRMIQEMGANTIRVYTILNDEFYNAFYEYNKNNDNPLYLIHGLWVNDYIQNSRLDAYANEFRGQFLEDSKKLVDVIHGKRQITLGTDYGTGFYFHDISKWVIGYILGVEWEDVTVIFTDKMYEKNIKPYKGKYMYSTEDASPFEIMLTEIGDKIIEYESTRYHEQRLVAFSNWPTTDPFDYNEEISNYFKKVSKVDVEHILSTDEFKSGQFASYHIYPYYPDYLKYDSEYDNYLDEDGTRNTYKAYLKLINNHHTMPVVISEFGVPSSRGMAQKDTNTLRNQGCMSEKEQGEAIVKSYKDIKDVGINSAIIFSWQDEWFKRTWNTMHGVNLQKTPYWSDFQTNEQHFGLLTFDPGKEKSISYVDGDVSEWEVKDEIISNEDLTLSAKYDEKFIYLYVNKKDYNGEKLYIPIDTTLKSGAKKSDEHNVSFSRDADFLIVIDGKDNSRILVQERYNTIQAMFGYETNKTNSYLNPPAKNSPKFQKINLILQTATPLITHNMSDRAEVYETGKLLFGNGNPNSKDFNSLTDFNITGDNIEIRIPWGLLNFSDPSSMKIHDDYYENYGVEEIQLRNIYLGVGLDNSKIKMEAMRLKPWRKSVTYHERLKQSYYMVQDLWKGGE